MEPSARAASAVDGGRRELYAKEEGDDVSYAGREHRKRGLVECDTCRRCLRTTEFSATRDHQRLLVSGLEPSCIDCVEARSQAVARERAEVAALRASEAARRVAEAAASRTRPLKVKRTKSFQTKDVGGKTILVGAIEIEEVIEP
jgi:hypothetical protein